MGLGAQGISGPWVWHVGLSGATCAVETSTALTITKFNKNTRTLTKNIRRQGGRERERERTKKADQRETKGVLLRAYAAREIGNRALVIDGVEAQAVASG